jgi:hypothetical protein
VLNSLLEVFEISNNNKYSIDIRLVPIVCCGSLDVRNFKQGHGLNTSAKQTLLSVQRYLPSKSPKAVVITYNIRKNLPAIIYHINRDYL